MEAGIQWGLKYFYCNGKQNYISVKLTSEDVLVLFDLILYAQEFTSNIKPIDECWLPKICTISLV